MGENRLFLPLERLRRRTKLMFWSAATCRRFSNSVTITKATEPNKALTGQRAEILGQNPDHPVPQRKKLKASAKFALAFHPRVSGLILAYPINSGNQPIVEALIENSN